MDWGWALQVAPNPMAEVKREVEEHCCECDFEGFPAHETRSDCKTSIQHEKSKEISRHVMLDPSVVTIYTGDEKEPQPFVIHKDLLRLHSEFFNKHFSANNNDNNIEIPRVTEQHHRGTPAQLAQFINWLYTGILSVNAEDCLGHVEDEYSRLWRLGQVLESPGFQNHVMWHLMGFVSSDTGLDGVVSWPGVEEAAFVYKETGPGSKLRKLVSSTLAFKHPFKVSEVGSQTYMAWELLLHQVPHGTDLSLDIHRALAETWNDTKPWDEEHRSSFMVSGLPVDKRWDQIILGKRSKVMIENAAAGGCILSKFELNHLNRKK